MTALITAADILACRPCGDYPVDRAVAALNIPRDGRVWALLNVLARRDRVALVRWAVDCAESVVHLVPPQHPAVATECLRVTRAWCDGTATLADVAAARSAVYDADACATYAYAAYAAADAVASATYAATYADAADAAYVAYDYDSVYADADDDERSTQLAALVAAFDTPTPEPRR